jgi:hypothetical protein
MMTNQTHEAKKALLVFITATIIDPAGNRVHTDAEISQHAASAAK